MAPVAVEITARQNAGVKDDGITLVDDVDVLSSTEVMLGCGDDNPYN